MKRIAALLGVIVAVSMLGVATPALAGVLSTDYTGSFEAHYKGKVGEVNTVRLYEDGGMLIFKDTTSPITLGEQTLATPCVLLTPHKASCGLAGAITEFNAALGDENDYWKVTGMPWLNTLVDGGPGNDTLIGGAGTDILIGSYGDDYLNGRGWVSTGNALDGRAGYDTCVGGTNDIGGGYVINCEQNG